MVSVGTTIVLTSGDTVVYMGGESGSRLVVSRARQTRQYVSDSTIESARIATKDETKRDIGW